MGNSLATREQCRWLEFSMTLKHHTSSSSAQRRRLPKSLHLPIAKKSANSMLWQLRIWPFSYAKFDVAHQGCKYDNTFTSMNEWIPLVKFRRPGRHLLPSRRENLQQIYANISTPRCNQYMGNVFNNCIFASTSMCFRHLHRRKAEMFNVMVCSTGEGPGRIHKG